MLLKTRLNGKDKPNARQGVRLVEMLETRVLFSTYYVAATGSDTAAGGEAAPFQTLQKAANTVRAGDKVVVKAGNYKGFFLSNSGTAASRITFSAETGTTINARNATTADGINLEGASFVTIEGFTIRNPAADITRAGIRSVTNQGVIIRNNDVQGMGNWAIFTGFSEGVTIDHNIAAGSKVQHGIYVSNSADDPVVRNNTVFGNNAAGIHMNGDVSQGGDGVISRALVENNVIYNNGVGGGSAINADGVNDSVFRNNVLYNNRAGGITLFQGDGATGSKNNLVVNNTVVMPSNGRWAVNITRGSTGNIVFNNVLYNAHTARGSITISADSLTGFKSDYNAVIDRFSNNDSDTTMTLAQWRTATGQDAHSFAATPAQLFTDVTKSDYHLGNTSPAKDTGVATFSGKNAPAADLEGVTRPQGSAFDIGAYEYAAPKANTPPRVDAGGAGVVGMGSAWSRTGLVTDNDSGDSWTATVNYGDGTGTQPLAMNADKTFNLNKTYLTPGTYPVTVSVTDSAGANASSTFNVTVRGASLNGTGANDSYVLRLDSVGNVQFFENTPLSGAPTFSIPKALVSTIRIDAQGGDDSVTLDLTNGNPVQRSGLAYTGGAGRDELHVTGGSYSLAGDLASTSVEVLAAEANTQIILNASQHLSQLSLASGAKVILAANGQRVLRSAGLALATGATLDLTNNLLVVDAPTDAAGVLNLISTQVGAARNSAGGTWHGAGITSSVAASDPQQATGLATVLNDLGGGRLLTSSMVGETLSANSILVKYTLNGDTNLDGAITFDDYFRLDAGRASGQAVTYRNGDFNYDRMIDASDYALIDKSMMSSAISVMSAAPLAQSAVAEPVAVSEMVVVQEPRSVKNDRHHRWRRIFAV